METVFLCFTVDDVGLQAYSSEEHLANLLQFCSEQEVKATFFAVPCPGGTDIRELPGFIRLLKDAVAQGHEVGQHGLEHDQFECGIPPKMVLDLPIERPARERLAKHRDEIEAALTLEKLRGRLRKGREILEDALGLPIRGFRAPCLSVCDNLHRAIEEEGYLHDSSFAFQEAAWDLINGVKEITPRPINRDVFDARQTSGRLLVFPLTGEYTWYLNGDGYDASLRLACGDFDMCLEAGIPCVPVCHVSPIQEGEGDRGFSLFRAFFAHARQQARRRGCRLVSATLSETAAQWRP